jgi:hypothetical protein
VGVSVGSLVDRIGALVHALRGRCCAPASKFQFNNIPGWQVDTLSRWFVAILRWALQSWLDNMWLCLLAFLCMPADHFGAARLLHDKVGVEWLRRCHFLGASSGSLVAMALAVEVHIAACCTTAAHHSIQPFPASLRTRMQLCLSLPMSQRALCVCLRGPFPLHTRADRPGRDGSLPGPVLQGSHHPLRWPPWDYDADRAGLPIQVRQLPNCSAGVFRLVHCLSSSVF